MADRLISIKQFAEMLGVSRFWFYRHARDPGVPRRVYVGGRPMLSHDESVAYVESLKKARPEQQQPARKIGRPRKITLVR